ncbi:hypothetical protein BDL97_04G141000 [Sphagnum fallax]|nr:hypothetical protein BDL97_04G141000 [Sphagnum fallax]
MNAIESLCGFIRPSSVLFVAGMTLWEDLTQSELDAKFLFPDSTISTDNCGFQTQAVQVQHETFESSIFESNPPPPAKRRRLLFNEDLTVNGGSSCGTAYEPILDPFKVLRLLRTLILVGQDDDAFRSSEDIPDGMPCLSSDNNLKISAENWMDACIEENDCSESYMAGAPLCEFSVLQNSVELCPSPYSAEPCSQEASLHNPRTPFSSQPSTPGSNASTGRKLKITIPLAYPFTLLKPSDSDGDVMTLSDINQLILKPPTSDARHCFGGSDPRRNKSSDVGVSLSGKSIVTCTRICTEGKGTITILRTKD